MSEERNLSRLILLGAGMRDFLDAMQQDPYVPSEHRARAMTLLVEWDEAVQQLGRCPPPGPAPVVAVLPEEELCEPAVQRERAGSRHAGGREPIQQRTERILLYLNQHGEQPTAAVAEALSLSMMQARYVLSQGPFCERWESGALLFWSARRVSSLWSALAEQEFGPPKCSPRAHVA